MKAGPHLGETEAAGFENEAKTQARLATEQEGRGGAEPLWEDAKLDLPPQICLGLEFMHKWPELGLDGRAGVKA